MEHFTFCKMGESFNDKKDFISKISLMIRLNFALLDFCNPNGLSRPFQTNTGLPECPRNLIIVSKTLSGKGWKHEGGDILKCIFSSIRECVKKHDP